MGGGGVGGGGVGGVGVCVFKLRITIVVELKFGLPKSRFIQLM